jgi:hypothetical protein
MRDTGTVAILEGGRLKYSRLPPLDALDPATCGLLRGQVKLPASRLDPCSGLLTGI